MTTKSQTQRALIHGIIAEPDDEAPRLVYADWLEEHGSPLGEAIRLAVELKRPDVPRSRRGELRRREQALFNGLGFDRPAWDGNGIPPARDWNYGTTDGIATLFVHPAADDTWTQPPPEFVERFGWYFLRVCRPDPDDYQYRLSDRALRKLLDSPLLERCLGLDLRSPKLSNMSVQTLARSPTLAGMLSLDLCYNHFNGDAVTALVRSPYLSELISLELGNNDLGESGLSALATAGTMPQLRRLRLFAVNAPAKSVATLFRATGLAELRSLDVSANGLDLRATKVIAESTAFPALKTLRLGDNMIDDRRAELLAESKGYPSLVELDLNNNRRLTDRGAIALLRAPGLSRLERLGLRQCPVGTATVEVLCATERFLRGGELDLWECKLNDDSLVPLADSPHAALLHSLTLGSNNITDAGTRSLVKSPHLKSLRRLNLSMCKIGPAGTEALTSPEAFPHLQQLEMRYNKVLDQGALTLARWCRRQGQRDLGLDDLTERGAIELAKSGLLAGLRYLRLGPSSWIGDAGWLALAQCPDLKDLRNLEAYGYTMTDEGAYYLAESPYLSRELDLRLYDYQGFGEEAFAALEARFAKFRA